MNLKFWKKPLECEIVPSKPPPIIKRNTLTIYLEGNKKFNVWVDDWKGNKITTPWKSFYRWFFGTNQKFFMVRASNGETLIQRDQILYFEVIITDVLEGSK